MELDGAVFWLGDVIHCMLACRSNNIVSLINPQSHEKRTDRSNSSGSDDPSTSAYDSSSPGIVITAEAVLNIPISTVWIGVFLFKKETRLCRLGRNRVFIVELYNDT